MRNRRTDNGAYYSGAAWQQYGGGSVVNETAFRAVAAGLREQQLPAPKVWQLDDWWYPGHAAVWVTCVQNWSFTHPSYWPSGLKGLSTDLGAPWILYVPFFCPNSTYT